MPHDRLAKIGRLLALVICLGIASRASAGVTNSIRPAFAEPTQDSRVWSEPAFLSDPDTPVDSEDPDIAVCDNGTVYVVWAQAGEIWYRVNDPVAGWSAPGRVWFRETGQTARGLEPTIDVSSDCIAHLVWSSSWFDNYEIFYSFNDGTGFVTPSRVSRTVNGQSAQPDIAVDSDGGVYVVWVDTVSGQHQLFEGRPTGSPGYWSNKSVLGADAQVQVPALAVDPLNRLHVTWVRQGRTSSNVYYKRPERWEAAWVEPISQSSRFSRLPDMAISGDKVVIVWQEDVDGDYEIFARWRRLDGTADFTSTNNLSNSDASSRTPALAVGSLGKYYVAWDEGRPTNAVLVRPWPGVGDWWDSQTVSLNTENVRDPAIAGSPASRMYAVWAQEDFPGDTWDIYFSDVQLKTHHFHLPLISYAYSP